LFCTAFIEFFTIFKVNFIEKSWKWLSPG